MFYKSRFEKGVRTVNDLFDNYGSLLSLGYFLKITIVGQCSWNMKACWQL